MLYYVPLPQVRLYAPYLMAEVTMQGDNMREAMSGESRGAVRRIASMAHGPLGSPPLLPASAAPSALGLASSGQLAINNCRWLPEHRRLHFWEERSARLARQQQQGQHDLTRDPGDAAGPAGQHQRRQRRRQLQDFDDLARQSRDRARRVWWQEHATASYQGGSAATEVCWGNRKGASL